MIRLPKTTFGAFMLLFWAWWGLLIVFRAFPGIDIYFSQLFFLETGCDATAAAGSICGGFPYRDSGNFDLLRTIFFRLPYVVAIVMLWKLIECYQQHGATFNADRARKLKVALGTLLIGPVLLVNVILKEHWGRPRPVQTDIFGGALHFVEAGSLAGKCVSNCSFVSGEAASAGLAVLPAALRSEIAALRAGTADRRRLDPDPGHAAVFRRALSLGRDARMALLAGRLRSAAGIN